MMIITDPFLAAIFSATHWNVASASFLIFATWDLATKMRFGMVDIFINYLQGNLVFLLRQHGVGLLNRWVILFIDLLLLLSNHRLIIPSDQLLSCSQLLYRLLLLVSYLLLLYHHRLLILSHWLLYENGLSLCIFLQILLFDFHLISYIQFLL